MPQDLAAYPPLQIRGETHTSLNQTGASFLLRFEKAPSMLDHRLSTHDHRITQRAALVSDHRSPTGDDHGACVLNHEAVMLDPSLTHQQSTTQLTFTINYSTHLPPQGVRDIMTTNWD